MATLTWERQDGRRPVFQMQGLETVVGREQGCAVRLDSTYVSKRHAIVRLTQQGYVVADLNSSNGTFINGQRVSMAVLKDGDRVVLGSETLLFSNPEAAAAAGTGGAFGAPAGAKRRGPMLLLAVGGGGVVLLLLLLILAGSGGDEGETPASVGQGRSYPAQPAQPATAPPVDAVSGGAAPEQREAGIPPGSDATALYESAMVYVKGGRLIDARRLLLQASSLEPGSAMIQQRLREVEATIQVRADQHLASATRAFTYLRFQDAIFEWEQVLAMTEPSDPRYQQATAGIARARQRLGQPIR
ncbi:MAG: FHA domain-containing protein [Acidobacteriota bacterium]